MLLGIEREIVIMKLIEHPNVLRLMDVWETESELYVFLQFPPHYILLTQVDLLAIS